MEQTRQASPLLTGLTLLAMVGLVPTAGAQPNPSPMPTCSPEAVQQALAGDYAGPPCRFTEMPEAEMGDRARLAGAPPAGARSSPATHRASAPSRVAALGRSAPAVSSSSTSSHALSGSSSTSAAPTVRLSDDFFRGSLVGGVGREPTIGYGYRGIIVIDASGRAGVLAPGQMSAGPVVRMEARAQLRTQWVGP